MNWYARKFPTEHFEYQGAYESVKPVPFLVVLNIVDQILANTVCCSIDVSKTMVSEDMIVC